MTTQISVNGFNQATPSDLKDVLHQQLGITEDALKTLLELDSLDDVHSECDLPQDGLIDEAETPADLACEFASHNQHLKRRRGS
jgi:hypothetical protein